MRLVRTATYQADLEAIVDYIATENPRAALVLWEEIETQVERLTAFPHSGRIGRTERTRELIVARTPYIVGYTVREDVIFILRVLHGARQWPDKIGG